MRSSRRGSTSSTIDRFSIRPSVVTSTAISLPTVAGDSPRSCLRVTVRDPTASPTWRYSVTTACRIFCARRLNSLALIDRLSSSLQSPHSHVTRLSPAFHDPRSDAIRHQKAAQSRADPTRATLREAFCHEPWRDTGRMCEVRLVDAVARAHPEPRAICGELLGLARDPLRRRTRIGEVLHRTPRVRLAHPGSIGGELERRGADAQAEKSGSAPVQAVV